MTARVLRSMDTLQTECRCLPSNSLTACVDMESGHFKHVLKKYKNRAPRNEYSKLPSI